METHGLDTKTHVFVYENEFYPLSNFSAFSLKWHGLWFPTSEHAYQWSKFPDVPSIQRLIIRSQSAHDAFKTAQENAKFQSPDWASARVEIMRGILKAKAAQHEYVMKKLLETGSREIVENSWRDDFWGVGPKGDGQNMLGELWMEVRSELRALTERS